MQRNTASFLTFFSKPLSILLSIALLFSMAGLSVPVFLAKKQGYSNLLMAVPARLGAPRIDIYKIEEFCKETFLLTYENSKADTAVLPQGSYPVDLIGTNSAYPYILGMPLLEGSFFSKEAWDKKQKHAVLNKTAATAVFGSLRIAGNRLSINGEIWLVTGVIQDNDKKNNRVYIPASVWRTDAVSVMALLNPRKGIHEVYAKNQLKTLGVQEGAFDFFNLETQIRLFRERLEIAAMLLVWIVILSILHPLGKKIKKRWFALMENLKTMYLNQLFFICRKKIGILFLLACTFAVFTALACFIILRIITVCIPWKDIPPLETISSGIFPSKIELLRALALPDTALFFGYLCFLLGYWLNISRRKSRGGNS